MSILPEKPQFDLEKFREDFEAAADRFDLVGRIRSLKPGEKIDLSLVIVTGLENNRIELTFPRSKREPQIFYIGPNPMSPQTVTLGGTC